MLPLARARATAGSAARRAQLLQLPQRCLSSAAPSLLSRGRSSGRCCSCCSGGRRLSAFGGSSGRCCSCCSGGRLLSAFGGSSRRGFLTTVDEEPPTYISPINGAPRYPSPWNKWFPYEPVPCSPYRGPVVVWCEEKVVYHYCTCGECPTQPWCEHNGEGCRGRGFAPLVYIPQHSSYKILCGSKHSGTAPFFNGTCWLVWADYNPIKAAMMGFVGCFIFGVSSTWMAHP